MTKPTGKLAHAYRTIAIQEERIEQLEGEQARAQLPAGGAVPDFARRVIKKLERVHACFTDGQDADIGKDWFDVLTKLGLLDRVQRSPALWQISDVGDALLDQIAAPHTVSGEQKTAFDAEWLVKILDSGEWRLTRFQYDKSLTHEANTRSPWQIERQTPPFCDRQDVSFWRGKTPEQALMAAIWALFPASAQSMGIPFTVCALAAHRAQAQGGDV